MSGTFLTLERALENLIHSLMFYLKPAELSIKRCGSRPPPVSPCLRTALGPEQNQAGVFGGRADWFPLLRSEAAELLVSSHSAIDSFISGIKQRLTGAKWIWQPGSAHAAAAAFSPDVPVKPLFISLWCHYLLLFPIKEFIPNQSQWIYFTLLDLIILWKWKN